MDWASLMGWIGESALPDRSRLPASANLGSTTGWQGMDRLVVLQHLEREGPGLFAREALARGWQLHICRLDQGASPPPWRQGDRLLVLGGPMGVADVGHPAFPWLQDEVTLLREALAQGRPTIGVCLGAQLLALAAGGGAVPLMVGDPPTPLRELGFGAITWTVDPACEPLLQGLAASELVLHWHGDRCLLPPQAQLLASSLHCREQVFRLGPAAVGLQCHVEVEMAQLERWLQEDSASVRAALGADGMARIRTDAARWGATVEASGARLVRNLLDSLN